MAIHELRKGLHFTGRRGFLAAEKQGVIPVFCPDLTL
jgi:hypothetical protein